MTAKQDVQDPVSEEDEKLIQEFLDENISLEKLRQTVSDAKSQGCKDSFIPVAMSPFEPYNLNIGEGVLQKPFSTTYALLHIWQSKAGQDASTKVKEETGFDLASRESATRSSQVEIGVLLPEEPKRSVWQKLGLA